MHTLPKTKDKESEPSHSLSSPARSLKNIKGLPSVSAAPKAIGQTPNSPVSNGSNQSYFAKIKDKAGDPKKLISSRHINDQIGLSINRTHTDSQTDVVRQRARFEQEDE